MHLKDRPATGNLMLLSPLCCKRCGHMERKKQFYSRFQTMAFWHPGSHCLGFNDWVAKEPKRNGFTAAEVCLCVNVEPKPSGAVAIQAHMLRGIAFHHDAWQQQSLQTWYGIWKLPKVTANIWEGDTAAFKGLLVFTRVFLIMNIVKLFFGCQQSGMTVGWSLTLRFALVWMRSNLFYGKKYT